MLASDKYLVLYNLYEMTIQAELPVNKYMEEMTSSKT